MLSLLSDQQVMRMHLPDRAEQGSVKGPHRGSKGDVAGAVWIVSDRNLASPLSRAASARPNDSRLRTYESSSVIDRFEP
jgi:hypothetical protein